MHVLVCTEERHEVAMNIDHYLSCLLWNVQRSGIHMPVENQKKHTCISKFLERDYDVRCNTISIVWSDISNLRIQEISHTF